MKKVLIVMCFTLVPALTYGDSLQTIERIELQRNHHLHTYHIVYLMEGGQELVSSLTNRARTQQSTLARLYQVSKNTAVLGDISPGDIELLFDWEAFEHTRNTTHRLIDTLIAHMQQNDTDPALIVKLQITRESL